MVVLVRGKMQNFRMDYGNVCKQSSADATVSEAHSDSPVKRNQASSSYLVIIATSRIIRYRDSLS